MPELWTPGSAQPSLEDLVDRVQRQIADYDASHEAKRTLVTVELADGARFTLKTILPEPGFGFLTLCVHQPDDGGDAFDQLVVPVGAIRRIELGQAEEKSRFGFTVPAAVEEPG